MSEIHQLKMKRKPVFVLLFVIITLSFNGHSQGNYFYPITKIDNFKATFPYKYEIRNLTHGEIRSNVIKKFNRELYLVSFDSIIYNKNGSPNFQIKSRYKYSADKKIVIEKSIYPLISKKNFVKFKMEFNSSGRILNRIWENRQRIYEYDINGQCIGIKEFNNQDTISKLEFEFQYDASERILQEKVKSGGATIKYNYNNKGLIETIYWGNLEFDRKYDFNQNLESVIISSLDDEQIPLFWTYMAKEEYFWNKSNQLVRIDYFVGRENNGHLNFEPYGSDNYDYEIGTDFIKVKVNRSKADLRSESIYCNSFKKGLLNYKIFNHGYGQKRGRN